MTCRRAVLAGAVALVVGLGSMAAWADDDKTARGTITAISGNSVTVKGADNTDQTFTINNDTGIIARGGATATRQAQKLGASGAKLTDILKVGEGVEIDYKEIGGEMIATSIRGGIAPAAMGTAGAMADEPKPPTKKASGKVTAVGMDSLTVNADGKDWKFMIDEKTRVERTGGSTKMRELEALGKPSTLGEFVKVDDEVTVNYTEADDKMHAKEIRVTKRAMK